MNESKLNFRLNLLIALVVCNLALTGYLLYSGSSVSAPSKDLQTTAIADQIAKADAMALAERLVKPYNQKNLEDLYAQFCDVARTQFTKSNLKESLVKLYKVVGKVDEYAYSHTVHAGNQGGKQFKTLVYKVRLSDGPMPTGEMKITVAEEGGRLAVYGFFIHAGQP